MPGIEMLDDPVARCRGNIGTDQRPTGIGRIMPVAETESWNVGIIEKHVASLVIAFIRLNATIGI
jgi:hypothetical protein